MMNQIFGESYIFIISYEGKKGQLTAQHILAVYREREHQAAWWCFAVLPVPQGVMAPAPSQHSLSVPVGARKCKIGCFRSLKVPLAFLVLRSRILGASKVW